MSEVTILPIDSHFGIAVLVVFVVVITVIVLTVPPWIKVMKAGAELMKALANTLASGTNDDKNILSIISLSLSLVGINTYFLSTAEKYLRGALKVGNKDGEAIAYYYFGLPYLKKNDTKTAIDYLQKGR